MILPEVMATGAYIQNNHGAVQYTMEEVFSLLPVLRERQNQAKKTLGQQGQQMLAIARTLMSRPQVILMDEISLGLCYLGCRDL